MIVGHEPDFSRAIQMVTGARIALDKGGIATVEGSELVALLRPRDLEAIGGLG